LLHCPNRGKNATGSGRRASPRVRGAGPQEPKAAPNETGATAGMGQGNKVMKDCVHILLCEKTVHGAQVWIGLEAERVENPSSPRDPSRPRLDVYVVPFVYRDQTYTREVFEKLSADGGEVNRQP